MYLTYKQLCDLIYDTTKAATDLSADMIRRSFQQNSSPKSLIDQDAAFFFVSNQDDDYDALRYYKYTQEDADSDLIQEVSYTRVLNVLWTFYGPSSYDNAEGLRDAIYSPAIHSLLSASKVYPISRIARPTHVPYLFNGQFYSRTDLNVAMNVGTTRETVVSYLTSANIEVHNAEGIIEIIEVERP